jgi:hypothetical protein
MIEACFAIVALVCFVRAQSRFVRARSLEREGQKRLARAVRLGGMRMIGAMVFILLCMVVIRSLLQI